MILIIGGAYQGKLEFARQLKETDATISDGRTISLDRLGDADVITHFHEVIRRLWQEKREISAVVEELLAKNPDTVIIMDEIGYEDYVYGEGVCLIEWANLIEEILPDHYKKVTIRKDLEKGFDYREIEMEEE